MAKGTKTNFDTPKTPGLINKPNAPAATSIPKTQVKMPKPAKHWPAGM